MIMQRRTIIPVMQRVGQVDVSEMGYDVVTPRVTATGRSLEPSWV